MNFKFISVFKHNVLSLRFGTQQASSPPTSNWKPLFKRIPFCCIFSAALLLEDILTTTDSFDNTWYAFCLVICHVLSVQLKTIRNCSVFIPNNSQFFLFLLAARLQCTVMDRLTYLKYRRNVCEVQGRRLY